MPIRNESTTGRALAPAPANFFMTVRDVAFWIRSARADARLQRLRQQSGASGAFDRLYADTSDPFGAELPQYRYQQRKYQSLLAMLPKRSYRSVLDIGCGLGGFARKIAPYADRVLGTDISAHAILQARLLSSEFTNIAYNDADLLEQSYGEATFDLIVIADILYYVEPLGDTRLVELAASLASKLSVGGLLLLVNHYFFGLDRASRRTRAIHGAFQHCAMFNRVAEYRRPFFLATLLGKVK
jgi:SAM-dependent methyltransferase